MMQHSCDVRTKQSTRRLCHRHAPRPRLLPLALPQRAHPHRDTMRMPSHSTMSRSSGTMTQTEAVSVTGRTGSRRWKDSSRGR